jgi:hypothetical protein
MFTDALRDPRSEIVRLMLLVSARSSFLEFVRSLVEAMRFLMDELIVLFDLDSWPLYYHSLRLPMVAEWWWHGVCLEFREESFLLSNLSTLKFLRFIHKPWWHSSDVTRIWRTSFLWIRVFHIHLRVLWNFTSWSSCFLLSSWPPKIQVAQKTRYHLDMIAWFARNSYPEFSPKPCYNLHD